jgi:hypothetical protein
MKPGPKGNPARVLRDAAIEYCADVEAEADTMVPAWDRLRAAAIRYAESEKHKGRPRNDARPNP